MATLGLKNINLLTKEQYDTITTPARDELYAIDSSDWGLPDYSAKVSATTTYTAPKNGWIYFTKKSQANPGASTLVIKDETGAQVTSLTIFSGAYNTTTANGSGAHLRAIKGYTYTTSAGTCYIEFYPDKGGI